MKLIFEDTDRNLPVVENAEVVQVTNDGLIFYDFSGSGSVVEWDIVDELEKKAIFEKISILRNSDDFKEQNMYMV